MNRSEACTILEISPNATKDEAKKAFKKKAAKFHPDVNKESGAEEQFKKVNEAWQLFDSGKKSNITEPQYHTYTSNDFHGFNDIFDSFIGNFGKQGQRQIRFNFPDIVLNETISFKESVLGCTRELKISRNIKCDTCRGFGNKPIDNGCATCKGTGQVTRRQNMTVFIQECPDCNGISKNEDCSNCKTKGYVPVEHNVTVNLPSRITDGVTLNLGDRGHYAGSVFGTDSFTRVFLKMKVIKQDDLLIVNDNVISSIKISLLEALEGCSKIVSTIDGSKEIKIPSLIRNKEEVLIPNLGIERKGNQVIVVNIDYPQDIGNLVQFLKEKS